MQSAVTTITSICSAITSKLIEEAENYDLGTIDSQASLLVLQDILYQVFHPSDATNLQNQKACHEQSKRAPLTHRQVLSFFRILYQVCNPADV